MLAYTHIPSPVHQQFTTGQCWQGALALRVRLWARVAADPPPTMCVSFAPAMDNPPSRTHQTPTSSDHCVISTASKLCCSRRTNDQWPGGDLGPALPPTTGLPRHWSVQTWAGRVHASTHCSQADTANQREHAPHHTCCSQARHTHVQASSEARAELCQCWTAPSSGAALKDWGSMCHYPTRTLPAGSSRHSQPPGHEC
jgi:hypothetical protein